MTFLIQMRLPFEASNSKIYLYRTTVSIPHSFRIQGGTLSVIDKEETDNRQSCG